MYICCLRGAHIGFGWTRARCPIMIYLFVRLPCLSFEWCSAARVCWSKARSPNLHMVVLSGRKKKPTRDAMLRHRRCAYIIHHWRARLWYGAVPGMPIRIWFSECHAPYRVPRAAPRIICRLCIIILVKWCNKPVAQSQLAGSMRVAAKVYVFCSLHAGEARVLRWMAAAVFSLSYMRDHGLCKYIFGGEF